MKEVVRQYAGVCLAVFTSVSVVFFLNMAHQKQKSSGWREILGVQSPKSTSEKIGLDKEAQKAYCERKKPVLSYVGGTKKQIRHINAGVQTNLYGFFEATDAEQHAAEIRILRVEYADGRILAEREETKEGEVTFPTPGKYFVVLQAVDQQKVSIIQRFAVPVDSAA